MRAGGNQWSGWAAYLSFFRHVVNLDINYDKFRHWEDAALFGPRFLSENFWIISALPVHVKRDEQNRPHSAVGPFCAWPDGFALWYWHGVRVPRQWIEAPESVDPAIALTWPNIEQRRCLAEIIGWRRIIEKLRVRSIDVDVDPQIGELVEVDLPDAPKQRFLRVRCATGRDFVLPVERAMKTAKQAQASTWGITDPKAVKAFKIGLRT